MTDKEMHNVLKDMVVVVDTREKKNDHILRFFEESNIPYIVQKMQTADYTFVLPNYPELELDYAILIEKKNSLDEISGNFTTDRDRFIREFDRLEDEHMHLVIENATWKKLLKGSYRSELHPNAFMASLITLHVRYNCPVWFVGVDESPILIYNLLHYELREHLKSL